MADFSARPFSYAPTPAPAPAPGRPAAHAQPLQPGAGLSPGLPPGVTLSFDVTEIDFEAQVLERSLQVPVLLDCWAPWCGPCKSLGPVLERLVEAYGGQFLLAKLNTDEAPQISAALRIRSIPLVVLFIGGRPVDQFTGALPEGQIRAFLDKHVQPAASPIDELRAAAQAATDAGEHDEALALLAEALDMAPGDPELSMDVAEKLITRGALDDAQELLDKLPAKPEENDRLHALLKRIAMARNKPPGNAAELAARIAANGKDFDARFALAAIQAYEGDWGAAFEQLLDVVLRDKAGSPEGWREKARLQLVDWFAVCPDADAVSKGRRYLGMYLN